MRAADQLLVGIRVLVIMLVIMLVIVLVVVMIVVVIVSHGGVRVRCWMAAAACGGATD
jgi:hypothetical protein